MDLSYEVWQLALAEEFFGPERTDHPVLFYVDKDVEQDLMERHGIDVPLGKAVGNGVFPGRPEPYDQLDDYRWRRWRENRGAIPAVLPLLAASVLAATRMMNDGEHRANNYHARFSALLTGSDEALGSKQYEHVAHQWCVLAQWLKERRGAHGVSTIPAPEELPANQSRIGFALSQALLQGTDRQLLPSVFAQLRQQNRAAWPPSGGSLVSALEVHGWTERFSAGFRRALKTPDVRPVAISVLGNLAEAWDGSPALTTPGTPRSALLVLMESKQLSWVARLPQAAADGIVPELDGGAKLTRIGESEFYSVSGIGRPDRESLARDVRVRGKGVVLSTVPASVVVLAKDSELGSSAWVSTETLEAGERYAVMAASSAGPSVKKLLEKADGTGRRRESNELPWVPEGWSVHMPVVWSSDLHVRRALDGAGGAVAGLRPAPRFKLQLTGGLKLVPRLDHDLYLRGGEPSLVIPEGSEGDIVIDGQPLPGLRKIRPEGVPVPLIGLGLPEGHHTVCLGKAAVEFSTAASLPVPAAVDRPCGFPVVDGSASAYPTAVADDAFAVRGADAGERRSAAAPSVVLCRRGVNGLLFIAFDGRVWEIAQPDPPQWWAQRLPKPASAKPPYLFEVSVNPSVGGWLLEHRAGSWRGRPVNTVPPRPASGSEGWAEAILAARGCSTDPRWAAYVTAAKEIVR